MIIKRMVRLVGIEWDLKEQGAIHKGMKKEGERIKITKKGHGAKY